MTNTLGRVVLFLLSLLPVALLAYAFQFRHDLLPIAFAATLVLVALWLFGNVIASIVYRLREGKYIFAPHFPDALFTERWLSGRGHKRFLFLRPGANNCLWLAVTADRLLVGCMFPFNLMFLPERLGLDYDLAASDILGVSEKSRRFGRSTVTVRYRSDANVEGELVLVVRDVDGFVSAVKKISDPLT